MITHIQNDKPEWQKMTKYTFLIFQCLQAQDFPNGNPNDLRLMSDVVYDLHPASYCKLQPTSHELLMEPTIFQNGPSWGSDFCSKNGQKYWYLQCFVTKVGLKPLF